jgi:hypothetical protein
MMQSFIKRFTRCVVGGGFRHSVEILRSKLLGRFEDVDSCVKAWYQKGWKEDLARFCLTYALYIAVAPATFASKAGMADA